MERQVAALQDSMRHLVQHITGLGEDAVRSTSAPNSRTSTTRSGSEDEAAAATTTTTTTTATSTTIAGQHGGAVLASGVWAGRPNPLAAPNVNLSPLFQWSAAVQAIVDTAAFETRRRRQQKKALLKMMQGPSSSSSSSSSGSGGGNDDDDDDEEDEYDEYDVAPVEDDDEFETRRNARRKWRWAFSVLKRANGMWRASQGNL